MKPFAPDARTKPCHSAAQRPRRHVRLLPSIGLALLTASLGSPAIAAPAGSAASTPLPEHLRDTGLYATGSSGEVRRGIVPFSPQYPLWSDGAAKRRWLALPAGTSIDASRPDAWAFPRGTRLWKEFAHAGRKVETRYIERRADGAWRYASYVWNDAGDDAVLAPAAGLPALPVTSAPGGRYDVPARSDCVACHEGAAAPVLGVSALQLSPDRDPQAAHAEPRRPGDVDLPELLLRGWLKRLPMALTVTPPRIAAASPIERAALGYLHGNCGHCHNGNGAPAPVRLSLAQSVADAQASRARVLATLVEAPSRFRPAGSQGEAKVVVPGRTHESVLAARMRSRAAETQMPPLGTRLPDPEGLALIDHWITHDLLTRKEPAP